MGKDLDQPYTGLQILRAYLKYYRGAHNGKGHGMHSPFVYQFIRKVLLNEGGYNPPESIEVLRKRYRTDERVILVEDLGAGSRTNNNRERTVKELARSAVKPAKWGMLLYRIVAHYKVGEVIELGTSLGITTSYLASAPQNPKVFTIEGSSQIASIAKEVFSLLHLKNIEQHTGNFDSIFPTLLQRRGRADLIYIDGNHRYEPTMAYFHTILPFISPNTILIFDDIHWSKGMEKAWEEIRTHSSVRYSIDLFFIGIIFFRADFRIPQHFSIRF